MSFSTCAGLGSVLAIACPPHGWRFRAPHGSVRTVCHKSV
ncbi:hypothetical protein [Mycolicibacterium setense]